MHNRDAVRDARPHLPGTVEDSKGRNPCPRGTPTSRQRVTQHCLLEESHRTQMPHARSPLAGLSVASTFQAREDILLVIS